jgi:hypothetical protein
MKSNPIREITVTKEAVVMADRLLISTGIADRLLKAAVEDLAIVHREKPVAASEAEDNFYSLLNFKSWKIQKVRTKI